MTVPVQIPVSSSIANGVTTTFPYTFKVLNEDDLSVTVDGVLITTGYSVTGIGEDEGGDVIFDVAPANGLKVIRFLNPVLSRVIDYQQFGDFLAPTVNGDFDRLWLAMQYINQSITRAIKLPVDVIVGQEITEDTADRANKVITFDFLGNVALKAGSELIPEVDNAVTAALAAAAAAESSASAADTSKDEAEAAALAASISPVAAPTHAASSKTTPVDADEFPLIDSAASFGLKKLTWANLKATLKTYFDTLYVAVTSVTTATSDPTLADNDSSPVSSDWVNGKALIKQAVGITTNGAAAYDFTGIPAGVKRIVISMNGVSTIGTSIIQVQLGSTTFTTSGYSSTALGFSGTTVAAASLGSGFGISETNAAIFTFFGSLTLTNEAGNRWDAQGNFYRRPGEGNNVGGGVSLSGVVDRLRLTTVNGTDLFDGGTVNISWEF